VRECVCQFICCLLTRLTVLPLSLSPVTTGICCQSVLRLTSLWNRNNLLQTMAVKCTVLNFQFMSHCVAVLAVVWPGWWHSCYCWDQFMSHCVAVLTVVWPGWWHSCYCWDQFMLHCVAAVLTVVWPGWWHSCYCWEDDVWPTTARAWTADVRRSAQEWRAKVSLVLQCCKSVYRVDPLFSMIHACSIATMLYYSMIAYDVQMVGCCSCFPSWCLMRTQVVGYLTHSLQCLIRNEL